MKFEDLTPVLSRFVEPVEMKSTAITMPRRSPDRDRLGAMRFTKPSKTLAI